MKWKVQNKPVDLCKILNVKFYYDYRACRVLYSHNFNFSKKWGSQSKRKGMEKLGKCFVDSANVTRFPQICCQKQYSTYS